ncbi:MAG: BMC domain-containing protein [Bacteroidaceae bacterium]|nr:BMC domain-containing protein [Bacteroidaceae bacterium]
MKYDELRTTVLMIKVIPSVSPDLQKQWNMPEGHRSVGFFSTDCDDVGYTAVDEATKKADVKVVLAKSMYGGAGCAQQKYAGEFIGRNHVRDSVINHLLYLLGSQCTVALLDCFDLFDQIFNLASLCVNDILQVCILIFQDLQLNAVYPAIVMILTRIERSHAGHCKCQKHGFCEVLFHLC